MQASLLHNISVNQICVCEFHESLVDANISHCEPVPQMYLVFHFQDNLHHEYENLVATNQFISEKS